MTYYCCSWRTAPGWSVLPCGSSGRCGW